MIIMIICLYDDMYLYEQFVWCPRYMFKNIELLYILLSLVMFWQLFLVKRRGQVFDARDYEEEDCCSGSHWCACGDWFGQSQ